MGRALYLFNIPDLTADYITIKGVFQDPLEAHKLCKDFDITCLTNYSYEYPIPMDWIDQITALILSKELSLQIKEIDENESIAR
jgi:hypothetical protein